MNIINNYTEYYKKSDLKDIVNDIISNMDTTVDNNNDLNYNTLCRLIAEHIFHCKEKRRCYFSTEKRAIKNKEKYYNIIKKDIDEMLVKTDMSEMLLKKPTNELYGPYGTQWLHELQVDDQYDDVLIEREEIYNKLRAIKLPEQRTEKWYATRRQRLTASDGGVILGQDKYRAQYTFIEKKLNPPEFTGNIHCYHGKKLEEPATMIYAYRMNVHIEEFGLMVHPDISFIGASPDGICNQYKYDGKTKSKYVGRMLEIKCPTTRKINTEGEVKGYICPIHYWIQVQLQLECCNLEECDFWQCKITEYESREEFIDDTDENELFRSKEFGFEKGCLIEMVPNKSYKNLLNCRYNSNEYKQIIYDNATFIYPNKIEMSPDDCDKWIAEVLADFHDEYVGSTFHKVIYWKLELSHNEIIMRDREWFSDNYSTFEKMWKYVNYFREHEDKKNLFLKYIDKCPVKYNSQIMDMIEKLTDDKREGYEKYIKELEEEIESFSRSIKIDITNNIDYPFYDNNSDSDSDSDSD